MINPAISIIIPVYNVENYLEKCLTSVVEQSFTEFEAILINDGSTDNSLEICKRFASEDKRLKIISQPNKGLAEARNTGLKIASGKYITGVDSDDWIEKDYLKILWEAAQKYRADIAICELSSNEDNISEEEKCMKDTISILDSREALTALYVNKFIRDHFCGKLFKKEIFGDIRFPKNKCFEDIFVMYRLFGEAQKIVKVDIAAYHYIRHPNSISSFSENGFSKFSNWNEALLSQYAFLKARPERFSDPDIAHSATAVNFYRLKKVMIKTLIRRSIERKELEKRINRNLKNALSEASVANIGFLRYINCLLVLHFPAIFYTIRKIKHLL